MQKQRRINTFVICGLIVVVGIMTVGYSALSQRLDISGTAKVLNASSSWNVFFSSVNTTGGLTGNAKWTTAPSVSTNASNTGTNNTITFACDLAAPGDACEVTATIKNGGSTSAVYKGYTFSVDNSTQSGTEATLTTGAKVTVTPATGWTADTTVLAQNDTGNFVIKMELPTTLTELPATDTTHTVAVSINFEQSTN